MFTWTVSDIVVIIGILFILQLEIRYRIRVHNEKKKLKVIKAEEEEYLKRLQLMSNSNEAHEDGFNNIHNTIYGYSKLSNNNDYTNDDYTTIYMSMPQSEQDPTLYTSMAMTIPKISSNRNIEKLVIEKVDTKETDAKKYAEESNNLRKITVL